MKFQDIHFVKNDKGRMVVMNRNGAMSIIGSEGRERERNVVVRFPSLEDAERCYNSPAYQEALKFALAASERDLCIIEGN